MLTAAYKSQKKRQTQALLIILRSGTLRGVFITQTYNCGREWSCDYRWNSLASQPQLSTVLRHGGLKTQPVGIAGRRSKIAVFIGNWGVPSPDMNNELKNSLAKLRMLSTANVQADEDRSFSVRRISSGESVYHGIQIKYIYYMHVHFFLNFCRYCLCSKSNLPISLLQCQLPANLQCCIQFLILQVPPSLILLSVQPVC